MEVNPTAPCSTNDTKSSIKDESIEKNNEIKMCRICWSTEGDDIISPCKCKGSLKYVHVSCINKWRGECGYDSPKYSKCDLCNVEYSIPCTSSQSWTETFHIWDRRMRRVLFWMTAFDALLQVCFDCLIRELTFIKDYCNNCYCCK